MASDTGTTKSWGLPPRSVRVAGCVPGFADPAGLLAFFPSNLPFAPVISKPVRSPCCSSPFGLSLAFNLLLLSLAKALGQLLSRRNGMLFPHGIACRNCWGALQGFSPAVESEAAQDSVPLAQTLISTFFFFFAIWT